MPCAPPARPCAGGPSPRARTANADRIRVRDQTSPDWARNPDRMVDEVEVTGPPWPFALKSSDAKTSGGRHVHLTPVFTTLARAGTAPVRINYRLRDFR